MKINILTTQKLWKRGFNDFYPLLKWRKGLFRAGYEFNFFYNHISAKIFDCDEVWIDYRYFASYFDTTKQDVDLTPVIEYLIKVRTKVGSVSLFDSADGTGSQCLALTQFVDKHLKKQLYKDLNLYTINNGDKSFMCWIPDDATPSNIKYYTTTTNQLHKFRLSWNVGLLDYRYFPFSDYYPIGTNLISDRIRSKIKTSKPSSNRKFITSYRGSISDDSRYSFQRRAINHLLALHQSNPHIRSGGFVSRVEYLKEMQNSIFSFSPFGWGEVCYRDFEIFMSGSLLVKPSMEHLNTFPDFYLVNKTYFPIKWDMSNLSETFNLLLTTPAENLLSIASMAQDLFLEAHKSEENFLSHFKLMME